MTMALMKQFQIVENQPLNLVDFDQIQKLAAIMGEEKVSSYIEAALTQAKILQDDLQDPAFTYEQIKRSAHSLKGAAGNMGLCEISHQSERLMQHCEALEAIPEYVEQFRRTINLTEIILKRSHIL